MKYTVIYEKTATGYSAYAPDLPGCIAAGRTIELTKKRMEKALEMHVAAMYADGDSIPEPTTIADYVDVAAYTPSRPRGHHKRPVLHRKDFRIGRRNERFGISPIAVRSNVR